MEAERFALETADIRLSDGSRVTQGDSRVVVSSPGASSVGYDCCIREFGGYRMIAVTTNSGGSNRLLRADTANYHIFGAVSIGASGLS